ncbi:MAG: hypothetical protein Fur0046_15790 [Cyanobacteria bacterium J069]|nr:MAG: hypothetical protein D6742_19995 [Cyanobacteria bacterium J069]
MKTSNLIFDVSDHNRSEYERFCDRLQVIDFHAITHTLQQHFSWTKQQINQGIERYQQLLFLLSQYPNQPIIPDQIADEVLHAHLETGDQFTQNCRHILGFELTHEAGFETECEGDRHHQLSLFMQTQALIEKHFGASKQTFSNSPNTKQLIEFERPAYCVLRIHIPANCILSRLAKYLSVAALS